jgi:hypothetical protein
MRLAFESSILPRLGERLPDVPVTFIGSLTSAHRSRLELLEHLCAEVGVQIWGNIGNDLSPSSQIHSSYMGPLWGIQMYDVLRRSRVTVNSHIGIAESYANNMRLFEATGSGTLLITDWKKNLSDLFEPEAEVVTYRSKDECVEKLKYLLNHSDEAEEIARAGQQRTLNEHTYYHRLGEYTDLVCEYL